MEHVVERAVEGLRPQMRAAAAIDELRRYPELLSRAPDAPFEDITDAEFFGHLPHVDAAPLVGECGVAGDDREASEAAERRDDVVHHAIRKIRLLDVAAEIGKGQNSEHRKRSVRRLRRSTGTNKAITDARHRHNPFLPFWCLSKRLAQGSNLDGQIAFLDDQTRPASLHQVRLGDNPSIGVEECFEQSQAALAQSHGLAVPLQQAANGIQDKRTERRARVHRADNISAGPTHGN